MEKPKKAAYKYCTVQECKNSIRKTPDKLFFRLPNDAKIRKQWCKVMRKVYLSPKSCLYCCEDHFNVQEDTANYIEYNIKKQQGEKCSLRLKKGVVPHIFLCRKRNMPPPVVRMGLIKRQRLTLVNEALSEFAIKSSNVSINGGPLQRIDHKLPNDMVNFMEYHKKGSVPQIRIKPDCLPTKFDCHPNRKCTSDLSKSSTVKRQKSLIEECLKDKNLNQDLVIQRCDEDIKVPMEGSVSETSEDITQRNAKNCKNYRRRKKSANQAAVKNIKTERCRKYRQRKKMLEHDLQSEKEVLHPPSTSSLQLTLEPQPIITETCDKEDYVHRDRNQDASEDLRSSDSSHSKDSCSKTVLISTRNMGNDNNEDIKKSRKRSKRDSIAYKRFREMGNARKRKFLDKMTPEQKEMKRLKDREYYQRKKAENSVTTILILKKKIKEEFDLLDGQDNDIVTHVEIKQEDPEDAEVSVTNFSASCSETNNSCGKESHIETPQNTLAVTKVKEEPGSLLSDAPILFDAVDCPEEQAIEIKLRIKMEMLNENKEILKRLREEISIFENKHKELLADIKYLQNVSKKKYNFEVT